ncbi:retrovirus-related pol polyprotein from transposon TNT 1-94 [Tanacetum coccineum]|uniref:Retrovirus-related pol polyprotein from transposon TNT 1-94 n=1 Tax=Tanacetum coccineum TaxID=301880 RepID=A0ABQ4XEW4_9ASTR
MSLWIISRGVVLLILLMEYKVLRDSLLHRSSINNSASLSNKFGGFYFSFKFGITGLLHHVITTIAERIRDNDTSQSKQNLQSSSMTFIHKTLIIPSVLDSCFISSTVCEVKREYMKKAFQDMIAWIGGNEFNPTHTYYNGSRQSKTMEDPECGIQVLRRGELIRQLQLWKRFGRLYYVVISGSKDRLPMLGPGKYSQWRSRFLWYIDTKPNGEGLRKSILSGPYVPSTILVQAKMWIAIKRLQQGESLNVQDVKTNLFWEFGKFTSRDGESIESYYSWFYKLMNELTRNNLQVTPMQANVQFLQQLQPEWSRFVTVVKQLKEIDTISYHTLFDILKQYQNEVNDIRAERIAKSTNPLALLAAAQPYSVITIYAPKLKDKCTIIFHKTSASTSHKAKRSPKPCYTSIWSVLKKTVILNSQKGIRICKRIWHSLPKYFKSSINYQQQPLELHQNPRNKTEDTTPRYNNNNQSGQFGNQRTMTVAGTRETVGSPVVQQTGIQCFNCKGFGHYAKECRKPKRVKDYSYHKEKMMMCKQAEQGVPLQADWLADTDEEIDEQELEAHYNLMAKIQEVLLEESKCADERAALANLIANLTLDTEENKTILKQLKKANASLTQELEECKSNLDESSGLLGVATGCQDS